ncbi:MAG: hypothetical protein AAFQ98_11330 [Bacteroidota bacterium]
MMTAFEQVDFDGREQVLFCHDPAVNLYAIIAIHSTVLGSAAARWGQIGHHGDPEYQEAIRLRHASFSMHRLLLQEGGENTTDPDPKL